MAGQPPDPRTLASWEDAFQHPLQVVHRLEQQLRRNVDENRDKLRGLVGASYRDLLGTAERIIEMNEQIMTVERNLETVGRRCNAGMVQRMGNNDAKMRRRREEQKEGADNRVLAQIKVLQTAITMVGRIIRRQGDPLQASKLLVLARLLYRSVLETGKRADLLNDMRLCLATMRSKLISYTARVLVRPNIDKTVLVHTLCSFALVTNSTPMEVLRYFLQTRYAQLESSAGSPSGEGLLHMLVLYGRTLADARDLFPRRFADALSELTRLPLLQDEQVQTVHELNLDVYGRWIAQDIHTFTPWIRHDLITASDLADGLRSWTKQAHESIRLALQEYLRSQIDVEDIVAFRREFLLRFLGFVQKLRNEGDTKAIHDTGKAFLARLLAFARSSASFGHLNLDMNDDLALEGDRLESSSLWQLVERGFDLSDGAKLLRTAVVQTRNGRHGQVQAMSVQLDEWMRRVFALLDVCERMRSTRWHDDVDFDLADLDDDGDDYRRILNEEDAEALLRTIRDTVQSSLNETCDHLVDAGSSAKSPALHLRIWRDVNARRVILEKHPELHLTPYSSMSLAALRQNLAKTVAARPLEEYTKALRSVHGATTHKSLWNGVPPLPVQPSPTTFRFLKALHGAMTAVGADLWSRQCVLALKQVVVAILAERQDFITSSSGKQEASTLTNGHGDHAGQDVQSEIGGDGRSDESVRDFLLQRLFDLLYLDQALSLPQESTADGRGLDDVAHAATQRIALESASLDRMKKNALEYWKRTYLLLGLLAPRDERLSTKQLA